MNFQVSRLFTPDTLVAGVQSSLVVGAEAQFRLFPRRGAMMRPCAPNNAITLQIHPQLPALYLPFSESRFCGGASMTGTAQTAFLYASDGSMARSHDLSPASHMHLIEAWLAHMICPI